MLAGRIDNFVGQKLYGWAFDDQDPQTKLEIVISAGDRIIGRGLANLAREDLKANSVGDGSHAFEIEIADADITLDQLSVVAKSPQSGEFNLSTPTQADRVVETAVHTLSKQFGEAVAGLRRRIEECERKTASDRKNDIGIEVDLRLSDLEKRIEGLEVFVFRIDESLRKLNEQLLKSRRKRFFFW